MTNIDRMEKALNSLLFRTNDDAFVIFEEVKTKKFVQFFVNEERKLLLDLPSQALNWREMHRAKAMFKEYGIKAEKYQVHDRPGGRAVGFQTTFFMEFDNDSKKAALIALRVFEEAYGIHEDFDLVINEN